MAVAGHPGERLCRTVTNAVNRKGETCEIRLDSHLDRRSRCGCRCRRSGVGVAVAVGVGVGVAVFRVKEAFSVIGAFIVIEAGLFVPE